MFNKTYRSQQSKSGYNLRLPIDSHWYDEGVTRVLLVIETIDGEDLRAGRLLASRSRKVVENVLAWSLKHVRQEKLGKTYAFAAVNFNDTKFFDQPKDRWPIYRNKFAKRVKAVIEELEPTTVIVFGDKAMETMYPKIEVVDRKRGWVFDIDEGRHKYQVTSSLDLENLYRPKKDEVAAAKAADGDEEDEDEGEGNRDIYGSANLLYYVCRNVVNALAGRNLYDLGYIKAKPVVVDTIEKFDKFYAKLLQAEYFGYDTETRNLTVHHNAIHTMQFAFSTKIGYVIPYKHPENKWADEERLYIHKKMRAFWRASPSKLPLKYFITQFGQFDIRVTRQEFNVPLIRHAVWDVRAGEFCLDENTKYLSDFGVSHGGLEQIFMYYGNEAYRLSKFNKQDRANPNLTKLSNPEFIKYAAMDVQAVLGIHLMQQERAKRLKVGNEDFLPHFIKLVSIQLSDTVHVISHMQQRGAYVDKKYLKMLLSKASPILELMKEIRTELYALPELKKANDILNKEGSGQASQGGLFGVAPWAFRITKPAHKILLFFNIMDLKPLTFTKGEQPQVDALFIKVYNDNPIVKLYGRFTKLSKLWGTYVKGWYNKLEESPDGRVDDRLRPSYDFFAVVTGRLNSRDPNLQQVPNRGPEAKYIKRAFKCRPGHIYIRYDYSAHEVRGWSIVSGDKILADLFRVGQKLRQQFRRTPTKEIADRLKREGDIHIQNIFFFFNIWVDKSHTLRDSIKQVVFGTIYGKGATALGKDIAPKPESLQELRKNIKELKLKEPRSVNLKEMVEELKDQEERARDPTGFAQSLIDKLFGRFRVAAAWLNWAAEHARKHYYVYSPIKMRRNLFAHMAGVKSFTGAMDRRAKNSPPQGFASQIGISAARLIAVEFYSLLQRLMTKQEFKKMRMLPAEVEKFVHDANYAEVPYKHVLHYLHIMQYQATYGVTKHYKDKFNVEFTVEPEIEVEMGISEDQMNKWDWADQSLRPLIQGVLEAQKKEGDLEGTVEDAMKIIFAPYEDPKIRKILDDEYPILGVRADDKIKETT